MRQVNGADGLNQDDSVQFVHGVPGARDVQGDICSTALEEGGVEMVLQIPGGMGNHCVRSGWRGDGGRWGRVRVHFSGWLVWA